MQESEQQMPAGPVSRPVGAATAHRAWLIVGSISLGLAGLAAMGVMLHMVGSDGQVYLGSHFPVPGVMPAGFEQDTSAEASAFRATCSQCHVLPSPELYDRSGWGTIREKMAGQMAARGLVISDRQIDQAIAYVVRHARSVPQ